MTVTSYLKFIKRFTLLQKSFDSSFVSGSLSSSNISGSLNMQAGSNSLGIEIEMLMTSFPSVFEELDELIFHLYSLTDDIYEVIYNNIKSRLTSLLLIIDKKKKII